MNLTNGSRHHATLSWLILFQTSVGNGQGTHLEEPQHSHIQQTTYLLMGNAHLGRKGAITT